MLGGLNIQAAASAAATNAATAAAGGGIPTWVLWTAVIVIATAALSPFLIAIGSAAVILTAFAVAGAATAAILTALGLGFAVLGAGILALGFAGLGGLTATSGPIPGLIAQFNAMKIALEQHAAPLAAIVILWAEKFIPGIQQVGLAIMTWFGDRLPGVLAAVGKAFTDLGPSFTAFGSFLGKFFDQMGSMTSIGSGGNILTLGVVFENFARLAIRALEGLLTVLGQLSQWFMERLPSYGPIVQQTFGLLGQIILGVASIWGKFADWLVSNWPAIMALVQSATASIVDQWSRWSPVLIPLIQAAMPEFAAALKLISQHMGALIPILVLALAAILVIGPALMLIVGVSLSVIDAIFRIGAAFGAMRTGVSSDLIAFAVAVSNWENAVILSVRNVISALDSIPGVNIALPDFVSTGNVAVNTQRGFGGQQQ